MKTVEKKKVKNKKKLSQVELMKLTRGSWGNVSPVTKIMPNKKKAKLRNKHNCWRDYE